MDFRRTAHPVAYRSTVAGVVLVALGVSMFVWGTALYDARLSTLSLGEVAVGAVPCLFLLRAVQSVRQGDVHRARNMVVVGGLLLLPVTGVAALFRIVANPCWDNPSCTSSPAFADGVLRIGVIALLLASSVSLILVPLLYGMERKSAGQTPRVLPR